MDLLKKLGKLNAEGDCVWGGDGGLSLVAQLFDVEPEQCAILFTAAPDMYEVLKEWSALDEVMKECGFCADEYLECDIHQGQLQQIVKMREAALLKAEGREV